MIYPMKPHGQLLLTTGQLHLTEPADSRFAKTVMELSHHLQVPTGMPMYALLSVISTTCQGRYRIKLPTNQVRPLSLAILIIVSSGGRKSTLLKHILAPLLKVEREERQAYRQRLEEQEAKIAQWEAERDGLLRFLKRQRSKGLSTDMDKNALKLHDSGRPDRPRRFRLAFEDATDASLFTHLAHEMPSASLITAEGKTLFDSAMFKAFGKLNALLSGDRITVDRANKAPLELDEVSLGILAMTQPGVLQAHLEKRGDEAREAGLYARLLVSQPESLSGQRFLNPEAPALTWDSWQEGKARLETLARENRQLLFAPEMEPTLLAFDDEASQMWVQYYNEIEAEMQPGGRFEHSQDHASKLAEIAARTAGSLHLFEGEEGFIRSKTLLQAIDLCNWSSTHFHSVFQPLPQACRDAEQLNTWFQDHRNRGIQFLRRTSVRQCCPSALRNRDRLLAAIEELQMSGHVLQFMDRKTAMLNIMPERGQNYY
ncbi:YfjI family protein [Vreelandella titanicae]|uniref:DUF3987 domain-containing protein n=1 Tax=Vreelandella titanicae TaxID=664683 RepID=A0AAP9T1C7_9GAMM|nr:YfjI family protein [Halomonas titanicae]QKS24753.1 hypothetical protein FX987_02535 [Halomonas titanicae]